MTSFLPNRSYLMHSAAVASTGLGSGAFVQNTISLFNIFVGLMVVAAILMFATGVVVWIVRLGIVGRSEGIRYMEWGVVILFVLDVVLAIVHYFSTHREAVTFIIALAILAFVVWLLVQIIRDGGAKKEEH